MKIAFYTQSRSAASSAFYEGAFESLEGCDLYVGDLSSYDVALFMTYDHATIAPARKKFPNLKIGIIDPRSPAVYPAIEYCDFIIADSLEMEDYWRCSDKPIFRYAEYPKLDYFPRYEQQGLRDSTPDFTKDKDTIYIGYHGNSLHIMEGDNTLSVALERLSSRFKLELLLMHNEVPPQYLERYKNALPSGVKVQRRPWSMDGYKNFLSLSDIGVIPNNLGSTPAKPSTTGDPNTDYCLSFKMTSNPGRSIVFGLMGIPVISDFFPSSHGSLSEGRGLLAHSASGWQYCLEKLITSSSLRLSMGASFKAFCINEFSFSNQNKNLLKFLKEI